MKRTGIPIEGFSESLAANSGFILKVAAILFFAILAWYFAYNSIHKDYPLPYHSDEWDHLAISSEIARTDQLVGYNPYRGWGWDPQWEQNYHLFQAIIMNFTGWDTADLGAVNVGLLLPQLMTFLMILFSFLLGRYLTKSNLAGLLAALAVLLTKPNVTILGYWFAVPMAFGLAFMPLVLLLFVKSFSEKGWKNTIFLLIAFAQIALVHPATALVFLPSFAIYLMIHPKLLLKNKSKLLLLVAVLAAIAFVMISWSVAGYAHGTTQDFVQKVLSVIQFKSDIYEVMTFFFLPRYLSFHLFFVSLVGMFFLLTHKRREAKILPLFAITMVPLIYLFFKSHYTFLAEYRRIFYFAAQAFVLLAGVGLFALWLYAKRFFSFILKDLSLFGMIDAKHLATAVFSIIIAWFLFSMLSFQPFVHKSELYKVAEVTDVNAFLWLKNNSYNEEIVLSYYWVSRAINVIGGNRILYANQARLLGPRDQKESVEFFNSGCDNQKTLLNDARYVYSRQQLACDWLDLAFSQEDSYLYRVK